MALPHIQIGNGMIGDALLSSVEVTQELNRHWWCTVVCRSTQDDRIPVEALIGKRVDITTVDDDGVEHIHFAGAVHDVALDYELSGSYTATLIAVSDSYRMDVTAHKEYYQDGTLASVSAKLAARHENTKISVHAADTKALNYVQYGETDWKFLHRIVDDHAAWMRPVSGGIEIFDSFQTGTTIEWRTEYDLTNFRIRGRRSNPTFSGAHYDHHAMSSNTFQNLVRAPQMFGSAGQLTAATHAASQQLPSGFEAQRGRAMTLDNYSDQLQAEGERSLGSAITGSGSSRNQDMKAGNTVRIDGPMDAQGTYGVVHVTHRWTPTSYQNDFAVTPWKQYRDPVPPEAHSWNGIVPARVVDHHDPKKMGRLKVQFFWQDGSTHWARATSPHAGPGRGFMFLPEVGDEVAVAFEDGDPERPVILGSLWNGVQQAPRVGYFGADADVPDNNVKRIYTKSGNRMQMVDTPGRQTAMLATPHHSSLTLSETHDSTGRPMAHIHSNGDILLTAPNGRVHIQSLIFTQEIGNPANGIIPGARAPAQVPKIENHQSWLGGFAEGLFDSTIGAIGTMIAHPIKTVEGLGHAIAHPVSTVEHVGSAVWQGGKAILAGDGHAAGMAVGTIGMIAVPFAGEAGAAGDVAEVSRVADVADAGTALEAGADAPLALPAPAEPLALPAPAEPLALPAPAEPLALPAPPDPPLLTGPTQPPLLTGPVDPPLLTGPVDPPLLTGPVDPAAPVPLDPPTPSLTPSSPQADIDALKAANADFVKGSDTFATNGVEDAQVQSYLTTPEGQEYISQLKAAAPSATDVQILDRAAGQISSGSTLPTMNPSFTDPLFKVVPAGGKVTDFSPFFTTQSDLNAAISSGKPLGDSFGLPLSSQADAYDVYQITPNAPINGVGPTTFSNPVAPTSELGGQFTTEGGGTQHLVPNRKDWSAPVQVGPSIPKSGGTPITFP